MIHLRQIIEEEDLLQYKAFIEMSERNISIVMDYANGASFTNLARQHGVSNTRIRAIIVDYIRYCHRYLKIAK